MSCHRPFSELRAKIVADPERAARLAEAERQADAEQAAYDRLLADVRRANALTQEQLDRAMGLSHTQLALMIHQADLYLSTLQSYLMAMGGDLELIARFGDMRLPLVIADDLAVEAMTIDDVDAGGEHVPVAAREAS